METETPTTTGGTKKILIISFAVLVVAGLSLVYLFMQKDTPEKLAEIVPPIQIEKERVYTQAEKAEILAKMTETLPKSTTTPAERARILQNISKNLPASTLSNEEKLRILQNLASSTKK